MFLDIKVIRLWQHSVIKFSTPISSQTEFKRMNIKCQRVDYRNNQHAEDLISLLQEYANDPMGGSAPLADHVVANLTNELAKIDNAFSIIAYADNKPLGLANCFVEFSTFKCRPLINIHDLVVSKNSRRQGVANKLLTYIEEYAKQMDCCKLTLEVLEGNKIAKQVYKNFGFAGYELDPHMGKALFWEKSLS